MQEFTSPAKGISDGEFTTSQVKCVYKTGARRSRGILGQWSVDIGIINNARNEYKSFKIGQVIYFIAINYRIHYETLYARFQSYMGGSCVCMCKRNHR